MKQEVVDRLIRVAQTEGKRLEAELETALSNGSSYKEVVILAQELIGVERNIQVLANLSGTGVSPAKELVKDWNVGEK